VTGYDLVSLFVGSEGTLGVITEARVKLRPVDHNPVWTISAVAENISDAIEAAQDTISNYLQPSILELIDNRAARHIAKYLELDFIKEDSAILIAQTDGPGSNSEALAIKQIWEKCGLTVEIETGREDLIQFRRSMHPALEKQGNVLIEDIAVPVSQLGKMFLEIRNIEHEFGIEIPTVAHAGDGNLHPNFIYSGSTVPEEIWLAADMMFKKALELGGTLTGEHGVGELKRHWLAVELGQSQFELQKKIKSIFDPKGLLNPGKVFEN
jgi:glycolate oxidase